MKRLAPNVRSSLANDASRTTIRWSLASLARLNLQDGDEDHAKTDTRARSNNTTAKKTKGGIVKSQVAETLLREVQIRLASQHEKCLKLLEQAEHIMDDPWSSTSSSSKQPGQTNDGGEKKRRIVRAINQSWKTDPTSYERSKLERNRAYDRLRDIEVLHADTYQLTHQLLSSSSSDEQVPSSPLFQNFTPANQSLLFSTFESIRSRHASTVEDMADIVIGLRQSQRLLRQYDPTCNVACGLDRTLIDGFLRGRLGVQLLCDHYVGLHRGKRYGGISVNCDLSDVVDEAMTEARHVCDANLGIAPEIVVTWHSSSDGDGREGVSGIAGADSWMVVPPPSLFQTLMSSSSSVDAVPPPSVTLVRPWVHHALVEVLKNATASSVRREVERMAKSSGGGGSTASGALQPSPVYVRILDYPSHVRICVFDQGVGLSSDDQHKAFLFAESSSGKRWDRLEEQQSYAMVRSPLGSLGVGLPLSKMMVQMFGGDVMLRNRSTAEEGLDSGCTTVVALSKDENVTERTEEELVPVHHDGFEGMVGDEADRSLA